jgi:hypothetical protein
VVEEEGTYRGATQFRRAWDAAAWEGMKTGFSMRVFVLVLCSLAVCVMEVAL